MDPLGHLAPWLYKDLMEKENGMHIHYFKTDFQADHFTVDIRPTIGMSYDHIRVDVLLTVVKQSLGHT